MAQVHERVAHQLTQKVYNITRFKSQTQRIVYYFLRQASVPLSPLSLDLSLFSMLLFFSISLYHTLTLSLCLSLRIFLLPSSLSRVPSTSPKTLWPIETNVSSQLRSSESPCSTRTRCVQFWLAGCLFVCLFVCVSWLLYYTAGEVCQNVCTSLVGLTGASTGRRERCLLSMLLNRSSLYMMQLSILSYPVFFTPSPISISILIFCRTRYHTAAK